MVIWLIGLSGSGKTTLGKEIARLWRGLAANTVLLDGDELRRVFAHDQTDAAYSVEGRRANAERMTALCEMLDRQGINVVLHPVPLPRHAHAEPRAVQPLL